MTRKSTAMWRAAGPARIALAALAAAALALAIAPMVAHAAEPTVDRIAGQTRYDTAAAVSKEAFPDGAQSVIVATGENFPDALAASSLAGTLDCPVVLTTGGALSSEAKAEIKRLGAKDIVVVGGTAAVSDAAANALGKLGDVRRVSGDTRYGTCLKIYDAGAKGWGKTAIVATGADYPDALSISGYAFATKSPIFLADPAEGLSADIESALSKGGFTRIIIVGGTAAVPKATEDALGKIAGAKNVKRLAGDDRYATSKAIADFAASEGMTAQGACIATGQNFPDALAGGALVGKRGSVMLLADEGSYDALDVLANGADRATVLGGTAAVPKAVAGKAKKVMTHEQEESCYTIAFDKNAADATGTTASWDLRYEQRVNLPNCGFARTGWTFTGWNTKADGTGTAYAAGQEVSKLSAKDGDTLTFYAQWGKTLGTYTWAELKAISDEIAAAKSDAAGLEIAKSYNLVGADGKLTDDSKVVSVGNDDVGYKDFHVRILGFRHDILTSDNSKKTGISFEFVECVDAHGMNDAEKGDTNTGGWNDSQMRLWLDQSELWNRLPKDLQDQIASVKKMTNNKGYTFDDDPTIVTGTDNKVWLLSAHECYGDFPQDPENKDQVYNAEGTQYMRYKDLGVSWNAGSTPLIKKDYEGTEMAWWLRSAYADSNNSFFYVTTGEDDGNLSAVAATSQRGVSPGFAL